MKGSKSLFLAITCLAFASSQTYADKGDLFLSVMGVADPIHSGEGLFGGGANLSLGANEQTDFILEIDWTAQPAYFDQAGVMETRYLVGSYFTPYFGDIRPKFGGSMGIVHDQHSSKTNDVGFMGGLHLQGLFDMSSNLRLFAEVNPSLSFGDSGGFSTLFKLGLQFRVSK